MNAIKASLKTKMGELNLDISFEIPGKGVTAFCGRSGSGKTTILRFLAGLGKKYTGDLSVNGETWEDPKKRIFIPTHKRAIGYVFQDSCLFPHLNVYENLLFGCKRIPDREKVDLNNIIDLLGIRKFLQRVPAQLSGGEKQRVAIARCLLSNPKILLLDEPLSSLDVTSKLEILPYLEKIRAESKIPLIYVSHSTEEINRLADYIVQIDNGKILSSGPAKSILPSLKYFTDLSGKILPPVISIIGGNVQEINHFTESLISILKLKGYELGKMMEDFDQRTSPSLNTKADKTCLISNGKLVLIESISKSPFDEVIEKHFITFDLVLTVGTNSNAVTELSRFDFKDPEEMANYIQNNYLLKKYYLTAESEFSTKLF